MIDRDIDNWLVTRRSSRTWPASISASHSASWWSEVRFVSLLTKCEFSPRISWFIVLNWWWSLWMCIDTIGQICLATHLCFATCNSNEAGHQLYLQCTFSNFKLLQFSIEDAMWCDPRKWKTTHLSLVFRQVDGQGQSDDQNPQISIPDGCSKAQILHHWIYHRSKEELQLQLIRVIAD